MSDQNFQNVCLKLSTKFAPLALLFVIATAAAGCTSSSGALAKARALSEQISPYRDEQSARVEKSNKEYRDAFTQLMDAFCDLSRTQLRQGQDTDAQNIADHMISDDKSVLIGNLRSTFSQTIKSQRQAITDVDSAVAQARNAYVAAYSKAKLQLAKLDTIQANLRVLATADSLSDEFQNATGIIKNIVETAEDAQKSANADAGTKPAAKTQTPSASAAAPKS